MHLPNVPGGMDLVTQDDEDSLLPRPRARGGLYGCQEVRRTVGTR
jgi:hypothetical protein